MINLQGIQALIDAVRNKRLAIMDAARHLPADSPRRYHVNSIVEEMRSAELRLLSALTAAAKFNGAKPPEDAKATE